MAEVVDGGLVELAAKRSNAWRKAYCSSRTLAAVCRKARHGLMGSSIAGERLASSKDLREAAVFVNLAALPKTLQGHVCLC